ncbi:Histone-lysine N-methyltransferase [Handroanthus impetiginosus]|uniref:Histone-lysine N-methyltransferase n=1 Tax=Handroanthus impetiginosus TaxID=429701 RepID=A0A2G9HGQ8_9LAMI|nr:Histone-lysine N-methyltransferase [Handroanthus impetiginosus]
MAPERDPRIQKAFTAMKKLGIDAETVKPVLKRLLRLYNRNWELIEEENFRTLADAIFESLDEKVFNTVSFGKFFFAFFPPTNLKAEKNSNTINENGEPPFKKPHRGLLDDQGSSTGGHGKMIVDLEEGEDPKTSTRIWMVESSQSDSGDPTSDPHRFVSVGTSGIKKCKDRVQVKLEQNSYIQQELGVNCEASDAGLGSMVRHMELESKNGNGIVPMETQPMNHSLQVAVRTSHIRPGSINTSQHSDARKKKIVSNSANDHQNTSKTTYDIASSTCGQVTLSLIFNHSLQQNNIQIPSADEVLSFAEQKMLKELCESYLQKRAASVNRLSINKSPGNHNHCSLKSSADSVRTDQSGLAGAKQQIVPQIDKKRVFHKVNDITNGTERVKISLMDEIGNEDLPNYIYSRIADEDCCSGCIGDCLSSSIPCACARDTGGEFAYTPEGLLNEKFLSSCISMNQSPRKEHFFYCQDCPLERAKNVNKPGKCKGHVLRKFIKECWRKCGCNMQCGNRVVQRGITTKLQVFLTSEGKGWGLRTLEELPKGAFICEYVGEILTNIELYERNKKSSGQDKHVYPVLLDADWATEGVLKDEDALCLDATHFGNVARFINHR